MSETITLIDFIIVKKVTHGLQPKLLELYFNQKRA